MARGQEKIATVALVAAVLGSCGEQDKKSDAADQDSAATRQSVVGTLSLEQPVADSETFVFRVTQGKETVQLAEGTKSDASGQFKVALPGEIAVPTSEALITMSRFSNADGTQTVLWSFVLEPKAEAASNMNALTSIAYEIGVLEDNLAGVAEASRLTAELFKFPGTALEQIKADDPKLVKLARIVQSTAVTLKASVGKVHKALAADARDKALDGKASGVIVEFDGNAGVYATALAEILAVIGEQ